jgi:hypothetical protein
VCHDHTVRKDVSVKLNPIDYKGHQVVQHSTKRMSRERKAKLRGTVIRRLLLINGALYLLGVLAALGGNANMLLLPLGVSAMIAIWTLSEYIGDKMEDGMVSSGHMETQDRAVEREQHKELRRKGQDPDKIEQRLDRGDAVRIADDGEIVFEDEARHSAKHK